MRIGIVGATGMVGRKMLEVLEERNVPVDELFLAASERSVGQKISYKGKDIEIISIPDLVEKKPDAALFSAGGSVSEEWAPKFAEAGIVVIDNSSAWRMHPDVPLVVPEVNADILNGEQMIIANPNCSTIQLVVALQPIAQAFGLERIIVSTYQSVSGKGQQGVQQMLDERSGKDGPGAFSYPIDQNCIPHCDVFLDNGYTKEEMKIVNESRKMLRLPELRVTSTAVRVPVATAHSESVNIELKKDATVDELRNALKDAPGIVVQDDPQQNVYPMPILAAGQDQVFVGRIRKDEGNPKTFNLWIVADNLRKGAATNAVQILEYLHSHKLISRKS